MLADPIESTCTVSAQGRRSGHSVSELQLQPRRRGGQLRATLPLLVYVGVQFRKLHRYELSRQRVLNCFFSPFFRPGARAACGAFMRHTHRARRAAHPLPRSRAPHTHHTERHVCPYVERMWRDRVGISKDLS